ncbi:MAG: anti-sigma factor [Microbacteriaceae bacterium]|nr:anti-sigma factor [Microbacteriaceae bacterium]
MTNDQLGHSDPEILAMMAMGEPDILLADELHVQECAGCLEELNSLMRVATLARSGSPLDLPLDAPGPAVWGSISRTLGLATDVTPAPFGTAVPAVAPAAGSDVAPAAAADPTTWSPPGATRLSAGSSTRGHRARRQRRRSIAPILAGALAVVVATGAILVATNTFAPKTAAPKPTILAEARLTALPGWAGSSGEAILEKTASGRQVVVTVSESRNVPGYREVWLISSDLTKLISVGVLEGTRGSFTIPADVNIADYPILDVSSEMPDGNPAHSGASIVRGTL